MLLEIKYIFYFVEEFTEQEMIQKQIDPPKLYQILHKKPQIFKMSRRHYFPLSRAVYRNELLLCNLT